MSGTGRRSRGRGALGASAALSDDDDATSAVPAPVEQSSFILGLKPLEDQSGFKPSVQLVANEYATRYLESIGVRPSKATLDLVHRNAPLTEANIKTTLRSQGHVSDAVHVTIPSVNHMTKVPNAIHPVAVLQLGIGNAVLAAHEAAPAADGTQAAGGAQPEAGPGPGSDALKRQQQQQQQQQQARKGDGGASAGAALASAARVKARAPGADFMAMASRYLHPFNLDTSLARESIASLIRATRRAGGGGGAGGDLDAPSILSRTALSPRSEGGAEDDVMRSEAVQEEMAQEMMVTPQVVLMLQAQLEAALTSWYKAQAPEALKGRLSPEEFTSTLELLSSDETIRFCITLVNFLHQDYVRGHPLYPAHMESRAMSRAESRAAARFGEQQGGLYTGRHSRLGTAMGGGGGCSSAHSPHPPHHHQYHGGPSSGSSASSALDNLQKHDLGYQAFTRAKHEAQERERQAMATLQANALAATAAAAAADAARAATARHPHPAPPAPSPPPPGGAMPSINANARAAGGPAAAAGGHAGHGVTASSMFGPLTLPGVAAGPGPRHVTTAAVRSPPGSPSTAARRAPRHTLSAAAAAGGGSSRGGATHSATHALSASETAALQRARLYALHAEFAGRFKALRQSRAGMFFALPLLVLSLRLLVSTLFGTLYPLWTRLPDGLQVLDTLDAAVVELFDPHGYLQRALSMIQSTPTAIEAVTRHPQRHGTERRHFSDTSPLMQATLQDCARSPGARKLLQGSARGRAGAGRHATASASSSPPGHAGRGQAGSAGGAGTGASSVLRTKLSDEQRAQLFANGLSMMATASRDPILAQLGDPVPTERASYLVPM